MTIDLSKVGARKLLKPKANRTPHWQRLRPGCFLGFRPATDGSAGTWAAKAYFEGKEKEQRLGSFGEHPENERFQKAKAAAEAFMALTERNGGVVSDLKTVADATNAYAEKKPAAAGSFKRYLHSDALAKIELTKLRKHHVEAWRERLEARGLAPATVNREMVPLRAALIAAGVERGAPNTPTAWHEALYLAQVDDGVRKLYLDLDKRLALLASASREIKPFLMALCLLPVRPGTLARLTVGDYDKRTGVLTIRIGIDKGNKVSRTLPIDGEAAVLFAEQVKNKLPGAPIFTRADGERWCKDTWKVEFRTAADAAKLPAETCAYTLRHCTITDMVEQSTESLLNIAKLAGTSVQMIEKHYGKLRADVARRALGVLTLKAA